MEVSKFDASRFGGNGIITELKVRASDGDYNYYLFPRHVLEKTLAVLKESKIYYDAIPADSNAFSYIIHAESRYGVLEYEESECLAVHFEVDINEIYEIIEYIDQFEAERITVIFFKNSELPEFQELLSARGRDEYSAEIQALMSSYARLLIDMHIAELGIVITDYMEHASFGKLLNVFSETVVEYICKNVTKRLEIQLREEMKNEKGNI